LLNRSYHLLLRWATALLGSLAYICAFIVLDLYVLHCLLSFTGFQPFDFCLRFFTGTIIIIIIIENKRWLRARAQAQIEQLTLQSKNIEAKFNLLKEQVNPTFLFHCLANLRTMVKTDDTQIETYILKLAEVYRYALRNEQYTISLRKELGLLRSYLFLMRYGREAAIVFEVEIAAAALDYQLPIAALQMLTDNCVKQHPFSADEPLCIRIFQKDEKSITLSHSYPQNDAFSPIDIAHLEAYYGLENIENGVNIAAQNNTYFITLKLF
jgi:sensor histidine kinase YesM